MVGEYGPRSKCPSCSSSRCYCRLGSSCCSRDIGICCGGKKKEKKEEQGGRGKRNTSEVTGK